jgi:hypothetical protein
VVVIVVVASGGGSSFPYTDFDEGECTDDDFSDTDPDEGVGEIDTIDCDEEHTAEAIGQFDLEGDDDDYPSTDEINEEIEDQCLGYLFEEYVGVDYQESVFLASGLPPGEDAWEDGARTVVCAIYGRTDDEDLEGSARDSEE